MPIWTRAGGVLRAVYAWYDQRRLELYLVGVVLMMAGAVVVGRLLVAA